MAIPAIINPLTGSPNSPAPWQPTSWARPTYAGSTTFSGASGVAPAGGMNLGALTEYINSLNRTGQTAALNARIPGGPGLEAKSSANIQAGLGGEVNPDVIRLLQRQAAERGVKTGVGADSDNTNAAYLQSLGLTSYQLQEQAQKDLTAALGRNPAAPLFDPTSQLLTPYQAGTLTLNAQSEADRAANDAARLALAGGGGGGGAAAPRTVTGNQVLPTTTGPTGSMLFPGGDEYTTADWWASIGFTPGQGASPDTGLADTQQWYDNLFNPDVPLEGGTQTGTEGFAGLSDIFGPDLSSIYGG